MLRRLLHFLGLHQWEHVGVNIQSEPGNNRWRAYEYYECVVCWTPKIRYGKWNYEQPEDAE